VDWVDYADASLAWPRPVAAALDAEYGVCVFGGTSWINPATPFVPPLPESWQYYFSDHPRVISGKLRPTPDYVIVNMGTNDGTKQTATAIRSWLKQIRAAVRPRTDIVVVVPFGGINRSSIETALIGLKKRHTYRIALGMQATYGLNQFGHPSLVSFDGLHPSATATAEYAARVVQRITQVRRTGNVQKFRTQLDTKDQSSLHR
jgi:hypothetical protein